MSRVTTIVYKKINPFVKRTHGHLQGTTLDPFDGHVVLAGDEEMVNDLFDLAGVDFEVEPLPVLRPQYPPPAPSTRVDDWDWTLLDKYTIAEYKEKFYRHGLVPPKGGRKTDYKEFALKHKKELSK